MLHAFDARDWLALVGFVSLIVGVALLSVPAAFIVAGLSLMGLALLPTLLAAWRSRNSSKGGG